MTTNQTNSLRTIEIEADNLYLGDQIHLPSGRVIEVTGIPHVSAHRVSFHSSIGRCSWKRSFRVHVTLQVL